jgi:putative transcriptional regulator
MAIRIQLDRILLERRMSLTELADRVGVTLANLSILKTGKARAIRFTTLDALCRELNCQPGDLLGGRCLTHEDGRLPAGRAEYGVTHQRGSIQRRRCRISDTKLA